MRKHCGMLRTYIKQMMAATIHSQNCISESLGVVKEKLNVAVQCRPSHLPSVKPRLVAVSKTKRSSLIIEAYQAGQRHFGENYVQELVEKSSDPELVSQCQDIRWHFIGHLQSNKVRKIVALPKLYMIETVHSEKLARQINAICQECKRTDPLCVMVQVNTSQEANKNGCHPTIAKDLAAFIVTECSGLIFKGLMTIGALDHDLTQGPNPDFLSLVECRKDVCQALNLAEDDVELSMGMSHDFEHAVHLGSTNIRVGSTIFGARNYAKKDQN